MAPGPWMSSRGESVLLLRAISGSPKRVSKNFAVFHWYTMHRKFDRTLMNQFPTIQIHVVHTKKLEHCFVFGEGLFKYSARVGHWNGFLAPRDGI